MNEFHRTVRSNEVSLALAELRPPKCTHLDLEVVRQPESADPSFEDLVRTVLNEVVSVWPDGTCFVVELGKSKYLQGRHFAPTYLIEFGPRPSDPEVWRRAREKGWIDPNTVPRTHSDYASRSDWWENPVQELDWDSCGLPAIAALLADAATSHLDFRPGQRVTIKIFCDDDADGDAEQNAHEAEPLPADVTIPSTLAELDLDRAELGLLL